MIDETHVWAVVLAAGEGSRLRKLTTRPCGTAVPKQFCSLHGGPTLLQDAIQRASGLACPARVCAIVAQQHREWWIPALEGMPPDNIIVQPRNRGTAIGVLYSVLHVLARDPLAQIILLPADHYVRDEYLLQDSLRLALGQLARNPRCPVLLGFQPEELDTELGYILPGRLDAQGSRPVARFIEKPTAAVCRQIADEGGLWNGFIIAASGQALLNLYLPRYAELILAMQVKLAWSVAAGMPAGSAWAGIAELYERLPQLDFSRDLLEGSEESLRVIQVPPCGWSDLGTPQRLSETVRRQRLAGFAENASRGVINLAARLAHLEGSMRGAVAGLG